MSADGLSGLRWLSALFGRTWINKFLFLIKKMRGERIHTKRKLGGLSLWMDRALSHSMGYQFVILLIIAMVTLLIAWSLVAMFPMSEVHDINHVSPLVYPFYLLIDSNALNAIYLDGESKSGTLVVACVIYLLGVVVFTGMLISFITNMISRRVDNYNNGVNSYVDSGHVVVLGYDDVAPSIIASICKEHPDAYVLMVSSLSTDYIRSRLIESVCSKDLERVIIRTGHRTSMETYEGLRLEKAHSIYVVGNRSLPDHDATNIECVKNITDYLMERKAALNPGLSITCVFEDFDTYRALQTDTLPFFKQLFSDDKSGLKLRFIPFNFYTDWAKKVFVSRRCQDGNSDTEVRYPLLGKGLRPDSSEYVHLVFVGTSTFGVTFATEAAKMLHFPNFEQPGKSGGLSDGNVGKDRRIRTRITFIDNMMDVEMPVFITRYRHFFEVQSYYYQDCSGETVGERVRHAASRFKGTDADFLDVEFDFVKGDIFSENVQQLLCEWCADKRQQLSIFLTMANQRKNFAISMNLPDVIYEASVPVFVRQDRASDFISQLNQVYEKDKADGQPSGKVYKKYILKDQNVETVDVRDRYSSIYPIGMVDVLYELDDEIVTQAMLINYLYGTASRFKWMSFDHGLLNLFAIDDIGDDQLKAKREKVIDEAEEAWRKLPVPLKWSNIYCACHIPYRLSALRSFRRLDVDDASHDMDPLSEEEIKVFAPVEHNRWNIEKLMLGFRKPLPHEDSYRFPEPEQSKAKSANKKLYIHSDIRPFGDLNEIMYLDLEIIRFTPWICQMSKFRKSQTAVSSPSPHRKWGGSKKTLLAVFAALLLALVVMGRCVSSRKAGSDAYLYKGVLVTDTGTSYGNYTFYNDTLRFQKDSDNSLEKDADSKDVKKK